MEAVLRTICSVAILWTMISAQEYNLESAYTTNFEHAEFGSVDVSCKTVVVVGGGDGVDTYEVVCSVHVRSNTDESSLGFGQTCEDGGGDDSCDTCCFCTDTFLGVPCDCTEADDSITKCDDAGSPVVTSISTDVGPIAGGTRLTIIGSNLAPSDEPRIYLAGEPDVLLCANITGTPEELTCDTVPIAADASEVNQESSLKLKWLHNPKVMELAQKFTYKGNPSITAIIDRDTFLSGGTTLTVEGENMDVPDSIIMIETVNTTDQELVFEQECNALSSVLMHCLTKDLTDIVGTDETEGVVAVVHLGFIFDGLTKYQDLRETDLRDQSTLRYHKDPILISTESNWKHENCAIGGKGSVKIEVEGTGLDIGISNANYEIMIGSGDGRCEDVQVFDNTIQCKSPKKPADSDSSIMRVTLHIGNKPFDLGSIEYISSIADCPITIVVIVVVIVVVLLVVVLTTCFLCRRYHRSGNPSGDHAGHLGAPPPYESSTELNFNKQAPIDEIQYEVPKEPPMTTPTLNGSVKDEQSLYYNSSMEP